MDKLYDNKNAACKLDSEWAPRSVQLLQILLADAATDVEVVTRELGLRHEMLERLRRGLDRLNCAQSVLAAVSEGWVATTISGDSDGLKNAGCDAEGALERVLNAMKLLAEGWPQNYPEGAVEWNVLGVVSRDCA
jgi:hypothetical protein